MTFGPKVPYDIDSFTSAHFDIPGKVDGWVKVKGKKYEF